MEESLKRNKVIRAPKLSQAKKPRLELPEVMKNPITMTSRTDKAVPQEQVASGLAQIVESETSTALISPT